MHCIESFDVSRCRQRLQTQTGDITCSVILKNVCDLSCPAADRYAVKFTPRESGLHYVHVKLNGVHVPGSPYAVHVGRLDADASLVRAYCVAVSLCIMLQIATTRGIHRYLLAHYYTRSTQPCIPSWPLNRVPASAGVRAGMSALPGGM